MSVFVKRAFVKMRGLLTDTRELAKKLALLETELKSRLDVHETAIVDVLQRIMLLLDPPAGPEIPTNVIDFHTIPIKPANLGAIPINRHNFGTGVPPTASSIFGKSCRWGGGKLVGAKPSRLRHPLVTSSPQVGGITISLYGF